MKSHTTRVGKQNLIKVAEQLFIENGYKAVSIRDIAQASGVTNAALYYYFPSKEALYSEVLTYHVNNLCEHLVEAAEAQKHPKDRLVTILLAYSEHVSRSRSPLFLLRLKSNKDYKEDLEDQYAEYFKRLLHPIECELNSAVALGLLQEFPSNMSPASIILGMLHGLIQYRRICPPRTISHEDIIFIVDVFWRGLSSEE